MFTDNQKGAIVIEPIIKTHLAQYLKKETPRVRKWLESNQFKANSGQVCLIPGARGVIDKVFLGLANLKDHAAFAMAANKLPEGTYVIKSKLSQMAILQWALAQYRFDKYKKSHRKPRMLVIAKNKRKEVQAIVDAVYLVRDLINTPCEDLGPHELSLCMKELADTHQAEMKEIVGDELLSKNYPAVHTVGRASVKTPRLLELNWGQKGKPLVSLVGKGVCFDSGGLDLKSASGMRYMKKDMGGAAHVLGLASLIMTMKLPIRLNVIVPAVENAVSDNAYRPGDIIKTRRGLTVEIGNTDAEGRLILADALTAASEKKPKLIIDFATLTGAARVAVGTEIAALFSNHESMAQKLMKASEVTHDPMWVLPLYQPYLASIKPSTAHLSNSAASGYGGAITAALFLQQFVDKKIPWAHFDIMAWNVQASPGRPVGGEAMGLRAVYAMLKSKFK